MQGEGPYVGATTLFVRFAGCDLRCRWCDSPHTWRPGTEARLETARGSGAFRRVPSPVSLDVCVQVAEGLDLGAHRFASLTGGEPLLQPEAAAALACAFRARGPRVLLETHGAAPEALEQVVEHVDVVSMDWKLASDVRREAEPRGARAAPFHETHARFLRVARRAPEVVVKVVVTPASEDAELDAMARFVAEEHPGATVVVQPVTPFGRVTEAPGATRLLALVARLSETLPDVRLIPQTHKLVGAP